MHRVRFRFLDPRGKPKRGIPVEVTMTKIPVIVAFTDSDGWVTFFAPKGVILWVDAQGERLKYLVNVLSDMEQTITCPS